MCGHSSRARSGVRKYQRCPIPLAHFANPAQHFTLGKNVRSVDAGQIQIGRVDPDNFALAFLDCAVKRVQVVCLVQSQNIR